MRLFAALASILVMFAIADSAAAQVRYSVAETPRAQPAGPAAAAGLRRLSWPGKVEPAAPAPPPSAYRPAPRPFAAAQPPRPVTPARYAPVQPTAPPPAPLPASIYDAAPPAPAPSPLAAPRPPAAPVAALAQAGYGGGIDPPAGARFYSLHRGYGETPDPIQMSPQFFAGESPDLAEPPPPVARQVTTASGRVVRTAPSQSPDAGQ